MPDLYAWPDPPEGDEAEFNLPQEVELYIQPDGSVVFADLAADLLLLAKELNPDTTHLPMPEDDEPEALSTSGEESKA